jgi:hypothetical protein
MSIPLIVYVLLSLEFFVLLPLTVVVNNLPLLYVSCLPFVIKVCVCMIPWVWPCSFKCVYCLISFGDRVRCRLRTPLHTTGRQKSQPILEMGRMNLIFDESVLSILKTYLQTVDTHQ